jgi:hypothetical protein
MRKARSARGELVDFDLLAIKKQLASAPIAVGVDDRRKFIDEKDGIRTIKTTTVEQPVESALSLGLEAAEQSAAVAKKK